MENGSWAPTAARQMKAVFEGLKKITICDTAVTIKSVMNDDTVEVMEKMADELMA